MRNSLTTSGTWVQSTGTVWGGVLTGCRLETAGDCGGDGAGEVGLKTPIYIHLVIKDRDMIRKYILLAIIAASTSISYALTPDEIAAVSGSVAKLCETPDPEGNSFEISGKAGGGVSIKLFDIKLEGELNKKEWEGIPPRGDAAYEKRLECVTHLMTLLIPKLKSIDEQALFSIEGVIDDVVSTVSRTFKVDETNSDHSTFGTNTKSYHLRFRADPEYVITSHSWSAASATRQSGLTFNVSGGNEIHMRFSLKCGPKTDRYRGWLKGNLATKQKKRVPGKTEVLARGIDILRSESNLPIMNFGSYDRFHVLDELGNRIGSVSLGEQIEISDYKRMISIENSDGRYVLRSDRV